jgi:tRNA-Thr(GGU) m(6)t(6)A37 methyltransferase TsaA
MSERAKRPDGSAPEGQRRTAESGKFVLRPIGIVRSSLKRLEDAPRQGHEGAPEAWVEITTDLAEALEGLTVDQHILLITWLHEADRDVLKVHPRDDAAAPLLGVFATRSPARPNPLGLHPVRVLEIEHTRFRVGPLEAVDGTPVVDIKPALSERP